MSEDNEIEYDTTLEDASEEENGVENGDEESENPNQEKLSLQELKDKSPADLLAFAEQIGVENAASMRMQDLMFAVLKTLAEEGVEIFGHQRAQVAVDLSAEANGLVGPFCVPDAGQGNLPAHPVHPVSGQFQFRDEIMNRPGPLHGQVQCGRAGHVQQA